MNIHEKGILVLKRQLQENCEGLTDYEALDIAAKMQYNEYFRLAYVVGESCTPVALEAIVMKLDFIGSALGGEHKMI